MIFQPIVQCNPNKAGYTADSVACHKAGAVMRKLRGQRQMSKCVTNQSTDRPTYGHRGVLAQLNRGGRASKGKSNDRPSGILLQASTYYLGKKYIDTEK